MFDICALGGIAISLAKEFNNIQEKYNIFCIDTEQSAPFEKCKYLKLQAREALEDFEEKLEVAKVKKFLKPISNEVTFIVSGASTVSAASLAILQILHQAKKKISILYIEPDVEFLSDIKIKNERVVRNVLQQYTRSGLFSKMCLVSTNLVESLCENLTISNFYSEINSRIAYCYHMIELYKRTKPISNTISKRRDISRIYSIGNLDIDKKQNFLFYDLKYSKEIVYYFAINSQKLEEEKSLFRKITSSIKESAAGARSMFGIYSTNYENDYVFVESFSPHVQDENLLKKDIDIS
tara:strand:+ start:1973 stop:2857 length:885 start_codon:yes stop_codon:yes gene_type:complete